ncbi:MULTISPECIES: GspH/FimT family pseudopilin [unclassified Francisella]|uniref:GspH/FimT family pseudopilin n=1 Tax=unclassified Francisella TaxID=2610885 RepID=UPI002E32508C|nr:MULTISPECIES: GspH/FimT family pseudopilin [unclassified Francisella]MED7819582.1 prepilin-type N-terminal cleavage/methylation domain-containing protein [Francisella sp. 19S2-4]MED7830400.1 prepilin-type N-terminal cleavage/methylation domain-containing protein [Francisella sp. 19S2-10]
MVLRKKKGFSLVEVMVVIAIMTILMMAAISSFTFYYKTFAETRLTNLQKLIEYSVIRARSDGKTVIVCAATPDSFDTSGKLDENSFSCANSPSWNDEPIIAFESEDGTEIYNGVDDNIIANLPQGHQGHIYINLSGSPSYIRISPNGFMATGNGNITYCDRSNKYQAALIINLVGRVVYTDSKTKDGGGVYTCE